MTSSTMVNRLVRAYNHVIVQCTVTRFMTYLHHSGNLQYVVIVLGAFKWLEHRWAPDLDNLDWTLSANHVDARTGLQVLSTPCMG
jgi:hypothetical protein